MSEDLRITFGEEKHGTTRDVILHGPVKIGEVVRVGTPGQPYILKLDLQCTPSSKTGSAATEDEAKQKALAWARGNQFVKAGL